MRKCEYCGRKIIPGMFKVGQNIFPSLDFTIFFCSEEHWESFLDDAIKTHLANIRKEERIEKQEIEEQYLRDFDEASEQNEEMHLYTFMRS